MQFSNFVTHSLLGPVKVRCEPGYLDDHTTTQLIRLNHAPSFRNVFFISPRVKIQKIIDLPFCHTLLRLVIQSHYSLSQLPAFTSEIVKLLPPTCTCAEIGPTKAGS